MARATAVAATLSSAALASAARPAAAAAAHIGTSSGGMGLGRREWQWRQCRQQLRSDDALHTAVVRLFGPHRCVSSAGIRGREFDKEGSGLPWPSRWPMQGYSVWAQKPRIRQGWLGPPLARSMAHAGLFHVGPETSGHCLCTHMNADVANHMWRLSSHKSPEPVTMRSSSPVAH